MDVFNEGRNILSAILIGKISAYSYYENGIAEEVGVYCSWKSV